MIDLVSTRAGASAQDAACVRLLARIITQAVADASEPFNDTELALGCNSMRHACDALQFLFEKGRPFEAYARLVGSDAETLRRHLLLDPTRPILRERYDRSEFFVRGVEATT